MNDELVGQEVPESDLPDSSGVSGQEVPAHDLPAGDSGQEVPESDLPLSAKLSTPLNPHPETPLNKDELMNIVKAPSSDPWIEKAQFSAGPGTVWGMPGQALAGFGARALKGAIETGGMQAKDEIDQSSLGQGDPTSAVAARIAGASVLGGIVGGFTGQKPETASSALKVVQDSKIGSALSDFLKGMGHGAMHDATAPIPEDLKYKGIFNVGKKAYDTLSSRLLAPAVGLLSGHTEGSVIYSVVVAPVLDKLFGKALSAQARERLAPLIFKAASSGAVKNPGQIVQHAVDIARGDTAMAKGVHALFTEGSQKAFNEVASEKERDKLHKFVESGGPDPQQDQASQAPEASGYAKGGEVSGAPAEPNNELANHWPEQNVLLNATRARVYNHLNSLRPTDGSGAKPYDLAHKDPRKERDYHKALSLAAKPLTILNHIKDGSLTPSQLHNFGTMFPEVHDELKKRILERVAHGKMKEEKKPPYHVRQAMSMFLGTELDSTLTQPNMMAAQQVFMNQKAAAPTPGNKTDLSKMSSNTMTADQSREKRLNKN